MPPVQKKHTSSKYLALLIWFLIGAAVLLFVFLERQQKQSDTDKSGSATSSETLNSKSQISTASTPAQTSASQSPPSPSFAPSADTVAFITSLVHEWENLDEPEKRDARLAELDTLLQTTDLVVLVRRLPADTLDFTLGLPVFQKWIKSNPSTSFALLANRSDVSEVRVRTALGAWFEKDPAGCTQYLCELQPGLSRETSLALATQLALKTSAADAANWAALLTPGPRQISLLEQIATALCAQSPSEAAAWVARQSDESTRERLYAALALARADKDPEQATDWILQSVRSGEIRDQAVTSLATIWAATDPALISTWIERFPEGEPRQTATLRLINLWSHRDRAATQAWISQLPPSSARDEAQSHLDSLPVLTSAE